MSQDPPNQNPPNQDPPETDRVERLLDDTLRRLPLRRAPRSLEARVLGELDRRSSQAWWRRSFAHWPQAARAGFVAAGGALAGLVLLGGSWLAVAVRTLDVAGPASAWVRRVASVTGTAGNLAASLADAIPRTWLELGLVAAVVLYACLFGLGAAAYRMLYLQPQTGR
jgi:hypothetical protein